MASGLAGFKERMKAIQDNIKTEDEKAETFTKANEELRRTYCRTVGKQQQLKDKIISKEEEIERVMKKLKEMEERVRQKEEFLKEAAKFNKGLTQTTAKEGGGDVEKRLHEHRIIYTKNNERYMQAKERKMQLEERFEHVEDRGKGVYRKVDEMNRELETCLLEEGRRAEQCKQTLDAAFKYERNCIGVERMLEELEKRTKEAVQKVSGMTKKKNALEEEVDETNYERRVVEATIKEILTKEGEL